MTNRLDSYPLRRTMRNLQLAVRTLLKTPFVTAIAVLLAPCAPAQTVSAVDLSAGLEQTAQRHPGECAYRYAGTGTALSVAWFCATSRPQLDVVLDASFATLTAAISSGGEP